MLRTIVVVGASLAGLRAAETLRSDGYDGRLVLVRAEDHLPYDRPPLSKQLLAGKCSVEQIALRNNGYDDLGLELELGRSATALDVDARRVELDGRTWLGFDGLVLACGAVPRVLPGTPPLDGIHLLRTVDDCLAIKARLDTIVDRDGRVVVVGAGFIGSEVAATACARGRRRRRPLAQPALRCRDAPRALDQCRRAGHRRRSHPARLGGRRRVLLRRALRACPLLLVRPVQDQDPVRGPRPAGGRGPRRR